MSRSRVSKVFFPWERRRGVFGVLGRIQNGRFIRPLLMLLMKVPLIKRWIEKGSRAPGSGRACG